MDIIGERVYKRFYKQKSNIIYGYSPLVDKTFQKFEEFDCTATNSSETHPYLSRCISLPDDRIFVIGGSSDMNCSSTTKQTVEIVKEQTGQRSKVVRANMYQSRAAFGIAVYPNFSQIFVAGG